MPALIGPAIDPTPAVGARVYVSTAASIPPPFPPPPAPADPDVEFNPAAPSLGPRVQVLLGEAITREVFGELTTADVDSWDFDVELLAGSTAVITASTADPLWSALGLSSTMTVDGRRAYTVKPKNLVVWIYCDGVCVWTGRFTAPVDIGSGQVALPAQGPESVFAERILGRAEQKDELNDRGSFEYDSVAAMEADGWRFPDGVERAIVADGVRGTKCLRVRGDGWVGSPRVTLEGAAGYGRAVIGSVFGKWDISIPEGAVVIKTWCQRTDSLAPSNPDVSHESAGVRPDDAEGWTQDPVESGARMSPQVFPHRCWTEIKSFEDVYSYYDLNTIRQSIQTGFPPGSKRDLSEYVERIVRDLNARSLGGSPTGLTTRIVSYTGVETSQRWSHTQRTAASDVLSSVLDADGGPECRITPGWVMEIHGAGLGDDNDLVSIGVHDTVDPGWTTDPGQQVDDYVVDTGRGSGATWISATVSTPFQENAWRTVAVVQGPVDRSLNETESWARAHFRAASRTQVTSEQSIPWAVAEQIALGDRPWVVLSDDALAEARRMRVIRMRWMPKAGRCMVTLGAVDA